MLFSVIIPARNEEGCIEKTISGLARVMSGASISHEIIVADDGSTDNTSKIVKDLAKRNASVRYVNDPGPHGFGLAVKKGLEACKGDAVAIFMADSSDNPEDVVKYYKKINDGYDCVFGSRFIKGSKLINYPLPKLVLNRLANNLIKILFGINNNDITNAFKCYRREVIEGVKPILSHHFNLTVELPLKAVIRGFSFATVPVSWRCREKGIAKFKIKEMGSRYFFIILYALLEKWLSGGDYIRKDVSR
jgi:dolichol-phosphate mannosyltransferase